MRVTLLAAALLFLAGCATPTNEPTPGAPAAIGAWQLDCALGAVEQAVNASWAQPCVARGSHAPGHKQEIWMAVNPKDEGNVVIGSKDLNPASSKECVWNGLAVTKDGGKTWKDVTIGGKFADRAPSSPFFGYACNTDPMLAFTKDGHVHYVVELYNFGGQNGFGPLPADPRNGRGIVHPGWDLVLATSTDGGLTFPDNQVVDMLRGDGVGVENDYSRMVVSPKTDSIVTMINTFRGVGSQGLVPQADASTQYNTCSVIVSKDGGKTMEKPVEAVGPDTLVGGDCRTISAAPDGTLVIMGEKGDQVWTSTSTDDGATWGAPAFVPWTKKAIAAKFDESKYRTGTNFEARFATASGNATSTLYVMYADASRDTSDEWMRSSPDKGKTWSEAVRINDDPAGSSQFIGNFAVGRDGSLHAFFFDKRYDPAHKLIDITHALSFDGGKTWTNERVTTKSWDGDLGKHQEGFPFIGDYIGADSSGNSVWAAFPDATTGITVIAAAHVTLAS